MYAALTKVPPVNLLFGDLNLPFCLASYISPSFTSIHIQIAGIDALSEIIGLRVPHAFGVDYGTISGSAVRVQIDQIQCPQRNRR